jgi:secreted trypsin-like serine protease
VYKSDHTRILCAGAIVDTAHILIAAHCLNGLGAKSVSVYVGSGAYDPVSAKLETVSTIVNHPRWTMQPLSYDLALLRLQDPLALEKDAVEAVCPSGQPQYLNSQEAVGLSWKSAAQGSKETSSSLVQTTFETHNLSSCKVQHSDGPQFCAYAPGPDTCDNASDGPLLFWQDPTSHNYFVVGVSSYGQGCAQYPDVVTDVPKLWPWVQSVVEADGGMVCS